MIDALLPSRPRRSVNLTPLIDVVFILLMFFMLTSTFSQWRSVELLAPVASQTPSAQVAHILILGADESLHLDGSNLPASHYSDISNDTFPAIAADEPLVIVPTADATIQAIVSSMEKLQSLGYTKVSLGNVSKSGSDANL